MHFVQKIARLALACGLLASVQAASAETLSQAVPGVASVNFSVPGELLIRRGDEEKLVIEAESKVLRNLDVAVKAGTLTLASKGSFRTDKPLRFVLTLRSLRSLHHAGSGNVSVDGFTGAQMQFDASGSGDLRLTSLKAERLSLRAQGSGNIAASGSGQRITIRLDGTGDIDATRFRAQTADARIDGAGGIRLHADGNLNAVVSGSGNIEYQGNAKVTQSVTGAGSVDRL